MDAGPLRLALFTSRGFFNPHIYFTTFDKIVKSKIFNIFLTFHKKSATGKYINPRRVFLYIQFSRACGLSKSMLYYKNKNKIYKFYKN